MRRLPFFLPMESCPRRCIYCHQGEITSVRAAPSPLDVAAAASEAEGPAEICFFGGSFTCQPWPRQKAYLDGVLKAPPGTVVRLSTHPLCVSSADLSLLAPYPLSMVELGISSLDDDVLSRCNRGYSSDEALAALGRVLEAGIPGGAQMMIGLPGQSKESSFDDLRRINSIRAGRPVTLRIYPCLVLKNTPLEKLLQRGEFSPLDVHSAALWAGELLCLAKDLGMAVQRVGLQESPTLGPSVVGGPHHPAFGELARAAELAFTLTKRSPSGPWRAPGRSLSLLRGHGAFGLSLIARFSGLSEEEAEGRVTIFNGADKID